MSNYIVKKGDNLTQIAKNHGMTLEQLMKLNNISADQANYIQVGQILKVQDINSDKPQITIDPNYQVPRATFNPGQSSTYVAPLVVKSTPTQSTTETLRPKPIDQATYLKNNAKSVQQQLLGLGYNLGKWGADGNWGNASQAAFDQAVKDGYMFKDGKFISMKPMLKPKTPPKTLEEAVQQNPVTQFKQMVEQYPELVATSQITTSKNNITENIPSTDQLKTVYQNGPGKIDALAAFLYHIVAPESWSMPHSSGLKDQMAAAITYNESLSNSQKEKDSRGYSKQPDGSTYVGYSTYGTLSNQPKNVNQQGTSNNAASKVMGGARYKINDDQSVSVNDKYGFNVVRDFTRLNKNNKPVVLTKKETDPYKNSPWKGLWYDIQSEYSDLTSTEGWQQILENFGTRQGKVRNNSFIFEPGEINERIQ